MPKYSKYNISKGQKLIINSLLDLDLSFQLEKDFEDLKNPETGQRLRFDFYIPVLNLCIEYDGKQHFEYSPEIHGEDETLGLLELASQQKRDRLKEEYCLENNLKLLRIKYSSKDQIPEIVGKIVEEIRNGRKR